MTSHKIGTVGEFMQWTQRVLIDPDREKTTPKRWFDTEATAAKATSTNASPETLVKLLSPENLELLHLIATMKPTSMQALAARAGRNESNLSRTLKKFQEAGIIEFEAGPRRTRAPRLLARRITLDLDLIGDASAVSVERASAGA